ncbi:septum formation initiator family protein [Nonomuraea sp. NPDC049309]|uniref:FtsB family cell division protein n=1 Tax=Nonomuraea sp. NPDC049309 TaxID=3364350 RepID=UPI003717FD86
MAKRPQLTGRAAILAVVVCAIAMSLAYPVREYISLRRSIAELRAEKARVEAEKQALLARDRQSDDPNWIKKTAKERLHYCGPGEKCYVVMEPEQGKAQAAVKQPAQVPPWYETLWESVQAADKGTGRRAVTGRQGAAPSGKPGAEPSGKPAKGSSGKPSAEPSGKPEQKPTGEPSGQATKEPAQPAKEPTQKPAEQPGGKPAQATAEPAGEPTGQPAGGQATGRERLGQ